MRISVGQKYLFSSFSFQRGFYHKINHPIITNTTYLSYIQRQHFGAIAVEGKNKDDDSSNNNSNSNSDNNNSTTSSSSENNNTFSSPSSPSSSSSSTFNQLSYLSLSKLFNVSLSDLIKNRTKTKSSISNDTNKNTKTNPTVNSNSTVNSNLTSNLETTKESIVQSVSKTNDPESTPAVSESVSESSSNNTNSVESHIDKVLDCYHKGQYKTVVSLWNDLLRSKSKKDMIPSILTNYDYLECLIISYENIGRSNEIQRIIDKFFLLRKSSLTIEETHRFLDVCTKKLRSGWLYSTRLLSFTTKYPILNIHQNQQEKLYMEVANLCFKHGKWKTCMDVVHLMKRNQLELTSSVLKVAIITCCNNYDSSKEKSMFSAYEMFQYMVDKQLARDYDIYHRLLHALNREQMYEKAKQVWIQLLIDGSVTGKQLIPSNDSLNSLSNKDGSNHSNEQSFIPVMLTNENIIDSIDRVGSDKREGKNLSVQLNDILYACHIATLCGLKDYDRAIDLYQQVYKRLKQPIHSYFVINRSIRKSSDTIDSKKLEILNQLKFRLTSYHIVNHAKHLLAEKDVKAVFSFLIEDLSHEQYKLVYTNLWNEVFNQLLDHGMITEAVTMLSFMRTKVQSYAFGSSNNVSDNSSIHLYPDLESWTSKLIRELNNLGEVDEALSLAEREDWNLKQTSLIELMTMLIRDGRVDTALELFRNRYNNTRSSRPGIEVSNASKGSDHESVHKDMNQSLVYRLIRTLISEGLFDQLPIVMDIVSESLTTPSVSDFKGAGVISTFDPSTQEELGDLCLYILKGIDMNISSSFYVSKASAVAVSLLQKQVDIGLTPTWEQIKYTLKILSYSNSVSDAHQILQLFSLRQQIDSYRPDDDRVYEFVMRAADVIGKWDMTVELFGDIIQESKNPPPSIFEHVIVQLTKTVPFSNDPYRTSIHWPTIQSSAISDIYQLMVKLQIKPTHKTEMLLLEYLPKDMKSQLQREIHLYKEKRDAMSVSSNA